MGPLSDSFLTQSSFYSRNMHYLLNKLQIPIPFTYAHSTRISGHVPTLACRDPYIEVSVHPYYLEIAYAHVFFGSPIFWPELDWQLSASVLLGSVLRPGSASSGNQEPAARNPTTPEVGSTAEARKFDHQYPHTMKHFIEASGAKHPDSRFRWHTAAEATAELPCISAAA